jgi:hypothetical protein
MMVNFLGLLSFLCFFLGVANDGEFPWLVVISLFFSKCSK